MVLSYDALRFTVREKFTDVSEASAAPFLKFEE
jgi:hypothetical protein